MEEKIFKIKITQHVEQVYDVKAKSKEEALEIAEDMYMDSLFDPITDDGDISHTTEVAE